MSATIEQVLGMLISFVKDRDTLLARSQLADILSDVNTTEAQEAANILKNGLPLYVVWGSAQAIHEHNTPQAAMSNNMDEYHFYRAAERATAQNLLEASDGWLEVNYGNKEDMEWHVREIFGETRPDEEEAKETNSTDVTCVACECLFDVEDLCGTCACCPGCCEKSIMNNEHAASTPDDTEEKSRCPECGNLIYVLCTECGLCTFCCKED